MNYIFKLKESQSLVKSLITKNNLKKSFENSDLKKGQEAENSYLSKEEKQKQRIIELAKQFANHTLGKSLSSDESSAIHLSTCYEDLHKSFGEQRLTNLVVNMISLVKSIHEENELKKGYFFRIKKENPDLSTKEALEESDKRQKKDEEEGKVDSLKTRIDKNQAKIRDDAEKSLAFLSGKEKPVSKLGRSQTNKDWYSLYHKGPSYKGEGPKDKVVSAKENRAESIRDKKNLE